MGKTIAVNDSLEISCRESDPNNKVISNNNIKCSLFKGDITVTPSIPTTIRIKVEKNITANTAINFNILSLKNPNQATYPVGITFKLTNTCVQSDFNRICTYYKSTKYLTFNTLPGSFPTVNPSYGTLQFNPNIVSASPG